jgi:hypothetical protein
MLNEMRDRIAAFWPYYVTQHRNPTNRQLHFIGNTHLLLWVTVALARRSLRLLAFAVASSYGLAWIGHFFFERNIPATFRFPVEAAICDMMMYAKMWRGEMEAEVEKYALRESSAERV